MKDRYQTAFMMILIAAAFSTLAFVIWPTIMYRTNRKVETPASPSPDQVVQDFYSWYLSYQGNPLVDKAYQSSEYLSPELITFLDNFTQSGGWNYDPILCAQDIPTEIAAIPARISPQEALVEVTTSFENHRFAVELAQADNRWLITNVICAR